MFKNNFFYIQQDSWCLHMLHGAHSRLHTKGGGTSNHIWLQTAEIYSKIYGVSKLIYNRNVGISKPHMVTCSRFICTTGILVFQKHAILHAAGYTV